jgi:hypothetical protein
LGVLDTVTVVRLFKCALSFPICPKSHASSLPVYLSLVSPAAYPE